MNRLTTDTPKDNLETALNLFYIKGYETWVRGGGPGPEYADVSLFNFIRDVAKTYIPDVELPEDDDDLSNMMPEWLMDGIDSAEGIVALLYTAAWAYAELRHKLKQYEDSGLEPGDLQSSVNIDYVRIMELLKADKCGRLVVLPFVPHSTMLNLSDPENTELMKDVCLYVAWKSSSGIVFHSPYNCFWQNIEKGYIKPVSEETEQLLHGTEVGNDKADSV